MHSLSLFLYFKLTHNSEPPCIPNTSDKALPRLDCRIIAQFTSKPPVSRTIDPWNSMRALSKLPAALSYKQSRSEASEWFMENSFYTTPVHLTSRRTQRLGIVRRSISPRQLLWHRPGRFSGTINLWLPVLYLRVRTIRRVGERVSMKSEISVSHASAFALTAALNDVPGDILRLK